jgi:hypothetical protein
MTDSTIGWNARRVAMLVLTKTMETVVTEPSVAGSAAPISISSEDQKSIEETLKALLDMNAWDSTEQEGYLCAKAMLSSLVLKTTNPDKVSKASQINRDKIRLWFKNLRKSLIIEVDEKGRSTGYWRVGWFEENGFMHLIMDVMCAQGLLVRQDPVDPAVPGA